MRGCRGAETWLRQAQRCVACAISREVHAGYRHVVQYEDSFRITGPAGEHTCVVLEPILWPMDLAQETPAVSH